MTRPAPVCLVCDGSGSVRLRGSLGEDACAACARNAEAAWRVRQAARAFSQITAEAPAACPTAIPEALAA